MDLAKKRNSLLVVSTSAMAQHDHHDQLSKAWLMDTDKAYQSFFPMVLLHYEAVSI